MLLNRLALAASLTVLVLAACVDALAGSPLPTMSTASLTDAGSAPGSSGGDTPSDLAPWWL